MYARRQLQALVRRHRRSIDDRIADRVATPHDPDRVSIHRTKGGREREGTRAKAPEAFEPGVRSRRVDVDAPAPVLPQWKGYCALAEYLIACLEAKANFDLPPRARGDLRRVWCSVVTSASEVVAAPLPGAVPLPNRDGQHFEGKWWY